MKTACLVLFAHGSRDPRWCAPFEALLADLQRAVGPERARLAYMEFASPTLTEVAASLHAAGVRRIRLLPLFLAAGAHVAKDIPEQVGTVRREHPDMDVEVLPPVGEDPRFRELLLALARESA